MKWLFRCISMALILTLCMDKAIYATDAATICLMQAAQKLHRGQKITIVTANGQSIETVFKAVDSASLSLVVGGSQLGWNQHKIPVGNISRVIYGPKGPKPEYLFFGPAIGAAVGSVIFYMGNHDEKNISSNVAWGGILIGGGAIIGLILGMKSAFVKPQIIECQ